MAALVAVTTLAACGGGGDNTFRAADADPARAGQDAAGAPDAAGTETDAESVTAGDAADAADAATPTEPPAATAPPAPPPPIEQVRGAQVKLELVPGTESLDLLTTIATRASDGMIFIGQQDGRVVRLAPDGTVSQVLDITNEVTPYERGSERGFLGLAVNNEGDRLFMNFNETGSLATNLRSYAIDADGNIDPTSRHDVLRVPQPGPGHKGGGMVFLPDGTLLLALGDGAGSRGRDAQDYTKVLGGIIRVLPSPDGHGYTIPADNPYVGNSNGWPQEIWAKGLRNPWGFHFDPPTGDLWLGDVGENDWEEFNTFPSAQGGYNFGWYFIEGNQVNHEGAPADARPPLFAYAHNDIGPAVIGGFVYRGSAIPELDGAYLFADMTGPILAYTQGEVHRLTAHNAVITAWGRDIDGEPLMLAQRNGVYRLVPAG